jgi:hypothetical protein
MFLVQKLLMQTACQKDPIPHAPAPPLARSHSRTHLRASHIRTHIRASRARGRMDKNSPAPCSHDAKIEFNSSAPAQRDPSLPHAHPRVRRFHRARGMILRASTLAKFLVFIRETVTWTPSRYPKPYCRSHISSRHVEALTGRGYWRPELPLN